MIEIDSTDSNLLQFVLTYFERNTTLERNENTNLNFKDSITFEPVAKKNKEWNFNFGTI